MCSPDSAGASLGLLRLEEVARPAAAQASYRLRVLALFNHTLLQRWPRTPPHQG